MRNLQVGNGDGLKIAKYTVRKIVSRETKRRHVKKYGIDKNMAWFPGSYYNCESGVYDEIEVGSLVLFRVKNSGYEDTTYDLYYGVVTEVNTVTVGSFREMSDPSDHVVIRNFGRLNQNMFEELSLILQREYD